LFGVIATMVPAIILTVYILLTLPMGHHSLEESYMVPISKAWSFFIYDPEDE
jgi:hypothetical protein